MKYLKENIVIKFTCLLMALQLITCSIYIYDNLSRKLTASLFSSDTASLSDLELDNESNNFDAIFEHDEQDKNEELEEETNLLWMSPHFLENKNTFCKFSTEIQCNYMKRYINTFHPDLIPDPPKTSNFS